ncbi:MAG: Uma2 family endonuclease [Capsulimonadales bacterium]|nr:Uma2 family endonuclease [Capsulimonadales bacterium]
MSVTLTFQSSLSVPPTASGRKRWTRDDVAFLSNAGLLNGRYELIDGELIDKMGQNRPHALAVSLVLSYLYLRFGPRRVQTQATMEVREDDRLTNRPEPDAVVLRTEIDRNPEGTDVLLAVEISDTTAADDLGFKVGLYARAGVAEYWVLDLNRRLLIAFRQPDATTGEWRERYERREGDTIAPLSMADHPIALADLLA